MADRRRRTAVVGSGIAGLTSAYILSAAHQVTLYEADERLGGHAHTHDLVSSAGRVHRVDSGFIVHNARTYPNVLRLFGELGVRTQPSEMSMSVRCEGCGLEYAGALGPRGLLARPRSAVDPRFLAMLAQIPVFHRRARAELTRGVEQLTLGGFLTRHRFSPYFVSHFAIPLVSAVWSCPPGTALRYPARYLFEFLAHHGMLSITGSPQWRTVCGGSRAYVEAIAKQLGAVHTATPVRAVGRFADGAWLLTEDGRTAVYDSVVLAVHPDQALRVLDEPAPAERRVLGAFHYARNPTTLHTDASLLPRARAAQASWNYLLPSCAADTEQIRVSYDMNRLQRLDAPERYVVTLNDDGQVPEERVLARMTYEHPVYTPESLAAQRRLPALNDRVIAYAGAYHGWGFHEDGCRAGVAAARSLGVTW